MALIAGAVVVIVAVAALRDAGSSHGRAPEREPRPHRSISLSFSHSPSGAAAAATTYMGLLTEAAVDGRMDATATMSGMTISPLGPELRRGLPGLARVLRARLASTGAPAAFEGWPLGYRVTRFSAERATVSVWHLDLAASSTLRLMTTDYATTTYEVRWVRGAWRIEGANMLPGPTPPPPNAPASAIDRFARVARAFSGYRNAP